MSVSAVSTSGRTFMLPDLGEGLTEAEVIQWLVAPGDEVQVDQIVVTVETAKATVDLPCPFAGPILTLHIDAGAVLEVGKPLLTVGTQQESTPGQNSGSGNVLVGYGTSEARRSGRRRVSLETQPAASRPAGTPPSAPITPAPAPAVTPKVISPVVRRLARDSDVNLAELTATGPGDVICRADVEAALPVGKVERASSEVNLAHRLVRAEQSGDIRIPLRGVRKAIAVKMTTSRREIPEATTWVDVDATALIDAKNQIKAVNAAAGIGVLALFARISIAGLMRFPQLNARVDVTAQEIVQLADINLSFAAASPRGLVVPVVHGAGQMTTTELASALRELTGLARDGRLSPAQMTDGTFTVNNYGVFGTDGATPIINYPEAAMLGVGRIIDRPWAHEGQVALRKVAQLGLTFDHRVCDGAAAGGFLRFVADCVERPALLLAEL
jgi:2-oxoisovalerate dehydrogenase E2 component (dihydrolipoyl transacylase)